MELMKLNKIKMNPNNPRVIKDDKFQKLVKSLKELPEMMNVRPVVVNEDLIVLGGNMRLKAMREAGWTEAPVMVVDWNEEKQRQFIIKDNIGFGEWDWGMITSQWNTEDLEEWGLDVWEPEASADYTLLDDDGSDDQLEEMASGVKKAIQIEFDPEDYEEAYALVKFFREQGENVGKMILDYLKNEKSKI